MRMRIGRGLGGMAIASALLFGPSASRAQSADAPYLPYRIQAYVAAPGYYGTTFGVPSYGLRQTSTAFSTPYGPGYAYGYQPATYLPGPYGAGIWGSGRATGQAYRTPLYGTFATRSAPTNVPLPPIGIYANGFGPGVPPALFGW